MTLTIEVFGELEAALKAQAHQQGLTADRVARRVLARALTPGMEREEEGLSAVPRSPQEAAARILELQKRVKPDPEGWTVHDYINHDRP